MASEAKLRQLKAKFAQLDKNGDGKLDFNELTDLLKKGNPRMTVRDVRLLFGKVDVNGDGTVEFDEFVEYLYKDDEPKADDRSGGRRGRAAAAAAPQDDGTEIDWGSVEAAFGGYGSNGAISGTEFKKICQDCSLFDRKYTKQDVDVIFAKVVVRGERKIRFEQFKDGLRLVATKKGVSNREVQEKVGESSGPVINATRADDVRFHDDKSLYTGQHADDAPAAGDRHARLAQSAAPQADDAEDDWQAVGDAFTAFAGSDMDGREFTKLCTDCRLFDRKYAKPDADIVFSKVCPRGQRRIGKEQFFDALRLVADKKGCATYQVQGIVANSSGPQLRATKADDVRFHDDKTLYTGQHAV